MCVCLFHVCLFVSDSIFVEEDVVQNYVYDGSSSSFSSPGAVSVDCVISASTSPLHFVVACVYVYAMCVLSMLFAVL